MQLSYQFDVFALIGNFWQVFNLSKKLIVGLFLVSRESLVICGSLEVSHIFCDHTLYLEWVEVLLEDKHVAKAILHIFKRFKLNSQHRLKRFKALIQRLTLHLFLHLQFHLLNFAHQLALHFIELFIEFVRLFLVRVHPKLNINYFLLNFL